MVGVGTRGGGCTRGSECTRGSGSTRTSVCVCVCVCVCDFAVKEIETLSTFARSSCGGGPCVHDHSNLSS